MLKGTRKNKQLHHVEQKGETMGVEPKTIQENTKIE